MRLRQAALLVVLAWLGCSLLPNHQPSIAEVEGKRKIPVGGNITLICHASDPDRDRLTYSWTSDQGRCAPENEEEVIWYAPARSCNARVYATVEDGRGGSATRGIEIEVTKITLTVYEFDVEVPPRMRMYGDHSLKEGYTVNGRVWVDYEEVITFQIVDEENWYRLHESEEYDCLVDLPETSNSEFAATVPAAGMYYFILLNESQERTKYCHLRAYQISP